MTHSLLRDIAVFRVRNPKMREPENLSIEGTDAVRTDRRLDMRIGRYRRNTICRLAILP